MHTADTPIASPLFVRAYALLDALAAHTRPLGISSLSVTRSLSVRAAPTTPDTFARALVAIVARHRALIPRAVELKRSNAADTLDTELRDRAHHRALDSVAAASALIRDARATSTVLIESFHASQKQIFDAVEATMPAWQSEHHPLTRPRKHIDDVSRQASEAARAEIERWMRTEGARITAYAVDRKLRLATERIEGLERYLSAALGLTPDEVRDELAALQSDALSRAFGVELGAADAARTAATALAGAVLSAVLGYALADVLLYYVLHAIIGFLNPWLLATSLAGATALYLTRGEGFVRQWIRAQVFARMRYAFTRPEHQRSLDEAIDKGLRSMLDTLADSFEAAAREVLDAAQQQQSALQDGAPVAAAEAHARDAIAVLDQLDALVRELRVA